MTTLYDHLSHEQLGLLLQLRDWPGMEATALCEQTDCSWDELLQLFDRDLAVDTREPVMRIYPQITQDGVLAVNAAVEAGVLQVGPDSAGHLAIWTVYFSPSDFPGQYIARKSFVTKECQHNTHDTRLAASLEELRAQLPLGLHCIVRNQWDPPPIVECWL